MIDSIQFNERWDVEKPGQVAKWQKLQNNLLRNFETRGDDMQRSISTNWNLFRYYYTWYMYSNSLKSHHRVSVAVARWWVPFFWQTPNMPSCTWARETVFFSKPAVFWLFVLSLLVINILLLIFNKFLSF